jgi:hypothetical protein
MKKILDVIFILFLLTLLVGCAGATPPPRPPLHNAAANGDVKTMGKIIDGGADINEDNSFHGKPIYHASGSCRVEAVRLLLDKGAVLDSDCLLSAAYNGCNEVIKLLIERGADINYKNKNGETALVEGIYRCRVEAVRLLLDRGAAIEGKCIYLAAHNGCNEIIKLLIERGSGADVNYKTARGDTVLANAAYSDRGRSSVRLLIENGAYVNDAIEYLSRVRNEYFITSEGVNHSPQDAIKLIRTTEASVRDAKTQIAVNKESLPPVIKSDIDELPAIKAKKNKNAYAIVIGIENYRQKLPKADFATQDAKLVADYLIKAMGYPGENVIMLTNEHAALGDFVKYFEKWLPNNVEKGGTVFVYYSGHGAPDPKTGGAYLVPYDGDPSFIDQTGYSLKRMYDALGKLPAKEIVIALDSCFSGAGGRSVIAKGARPLVMNLQSNMALSRNMTVLSASSGEQISSTYDEKGHGLFTYFMLKGIKNEDVVRPDGSIKMDDLFGYLKPQVERIARKQYNNEQTPQLIGAKKN